MIYRSVLFVLLFIIFLADPAATKAATETVRIYGGTGDGQVITAPYVSPWNVQYYNTVGRDSDHTSETVSVLSGAFHTPTNYLGIIRGFLVFDTTALPDNANILGAKIGLHILGTRDDYNDQFGYVSLLEGRQVSATSITENDIALCGSSIEDPEKGSNDIDITAIETDAYQEIALNEIGLGWVNKAGYSKFCVREGHDIENEETLKNYYDATWDESAIVFASADAANANTRPYLEITFEVSEEDPEPENRYPLYTQIVATVPPAAAEATWAEEAMPCGKIKACGCAITSLVMAGRASGVETGVDGKNVDPGTLNAWLKDNKGYSGGTLLWSKALDYFGVKNEETGKIATPLRLKQHNATSSAAIQAAASGPEHVVGFSDRVAGGHYFVVSDYVSGSYQVRDPWYYETKTLDDVDNDETYVFDYNNDLDKANILAESEAVALSGFLEIVLASPAELRLENEAKQVTGYDAAGDRYEIPTASYDPAEYIGDPAAPVPAEPHYLKRMMVTEAAGEYILSVVGTGTGEYTLGISLRDSAGGVHDWEFVKPTMVGWVDRYRINVETGEVEALPMQLEDVLGGVDRDIEDGVLNRFFKLWVEKIFGEMAGGKWLQAEKHLETLETLMMAKKVESPVLSMLLERWEGELALEMGEAGTIAIAEEATELAME